MHCLSGQLALFRGYIFKHFPKGLCLDMLKPFVGIHDRCEAEGVVPVYGAGALLVRFRIECSIIKLCSVCNGIRRKLTAVGDVSVELLV